jgi:hypothetical protein
MAERLGADLEALRVPVGCISANLEGPPHHDRSPGHLHCKKPGGLAILPECTRKLACFQF